MKVNLKGLAGVGGVAFAATGWGLYGSSGSHQPATLTKEETKPNLLPPMVQPIEVGGVVKEQQRLVWEINTRDGIIDWKNVQIEELNKDLEKKERDINSMAKSTLDLVNTNLYLRKKVSDLEKENKDWEEYVEDLERYAKEAEVYIDWAETKINK